MNPARISNGIPGVLRNSIPAAMAHDWHHFPVIVAFLPAPEGKARPLVFSRVTDDQLAATLRAVADLLDAGQLDAHEGGQD